MTRNQRLARAAVRTRPRFDFSTFTETELDARIRDLEGELFGSLGDLEAERDRIDGLIRKKRAEAP